MAAEDQILGGFPVSRAGVHISCHQPGAGGLHQLPAVAVLSHRLIGGGEIDDDRRARQTVRGGGSLRGPEILADLAAHHKALHAVAGKKDLPPEGDLPAFKGKEGNLLRRGREMSGFIKFPVRRQRRLGNKGEHPPVLDGRRRVVQLPVLFQRKADEHQGVKPFGMLRDLCKRFLRSRKQRLLQEQILAGIAGQAQLGENEDMRSVFCRLINPLFNLFRVVRGIRHPDLRRQRRRSDKTVFHSYLHAEAVYRSLICFRSSTLN